MSFAWPKEICFALDHEPQFTVIREDNLVISAELKQDHLWSLKCSFTLVVVSPQLRWFGLTGFLFLGKC